MASLLQNCLTAEEQAIAIYEAECWILERTAFTPGRRKTLALCGQILIEEQGHRGDIETFLEKTPTLNAAIALSKLGGYALGGLLSALPSRLSWKVHFWAELQAAEIYRKAASSGDYAADKSLTAVLLHAEDQELKHSQQFAKLG